MAAQAHDIITTSITFDREIIRILYDRCNSCPWRITKLTTNPAV
jgi:hypothetical protein